LTLHFKRVPRGTSTEDRIAYYSTPEPTTGCLLWLGTVNVHGYAVLGVTTSSGARMERVSRLVAAKKFGVDAVKGQHVLHRCDQPACIAIEHLFLGQPRDNKADSMNKLRHNFGARNGRAKLTVGQAKEIKKRCRAGESAEQLSQEYGVGRDTIRAIRAGRRWALALEVSA
jgi:hypothetical protein